MSERRCDVCSWQFIGRVPANDTRRIGIACDDPHELRCRGCGRSVAVRCGTAQGARCGPCGTDHRRRVRRVAGSGLTVSRLGVFVTLTAPGGVAHRLPSGSLCPCTPVGGADVGRWNAAASKRWNRFCQDLRRTIGHVQYFRAAEVQRRGALHYHLLVRGDGGRPVALSLATLRSLAIKHGFGHAVDVQPVQPGHASYVAKYASKAADARADVPWDGWRTTGGRWVCKTTGEVKVKPRRRVKAYQPTYRTWSSSREWGESMRQVRAAQEHYAATVSVLPDWTGLSVGCGWSMLVGLRVVPDECRPDPGDRTPPP